MSKTIRGIYHDLNDSEYSTSNNEVEYFFSSKLYLGKFMDDYLINRKEVREKLERVFDISELNFDYVADFHLYKSIEKRGFKILIDGCDTDWQKTLIFGLCNVTKESILAYEET